MQTKPDVMRYLASQGVCCPVCNSFSIEGGNVDWDTPMHQDVECLDCGYKWKDILQVTDILDESGSPVDGGPRVPLLQLLDCYWIGAVRDGEVEMSGPYDIADTGSSLMMVSHLHTERQREGKGADFYFTMRIDVQTGKMVPAIVQL